jgi:hypothetical protein
VKAEILRRREEALAHPEKLEAWESAFPRMKRRFDELRILTSADTEAVKLPLG